MFNESYFKGPRAITQMIEYKRSIVDARFHSSALITQPEVASKNKEPRELFSSSIRKK